MKKIFLLLFPFLLLGCKTCSLNDQYGKLVEIENGQFKDMMSQEEYHVVFDVPQDVEVAGSPLVRLGIPSHSIKEITVKRTAESSSQGGTIFSAIGDACIGACKLAAGIF